MEAATVAGPPPQVVAEEIAGWRGINFFKPVPGLLRLKAVNSLLDLGKKTLGFIAEPNKVGTESGPFQL